MNTNNNENLITVEMCTKKLVDLLKSSTNPKDSESKLKAMMGVTQYMLSNYTRLTPEAQKRADDLQRTFIEVIEELIPNLPDTIETRKIKRLARGAKGERLFAKIHLDALENPVKNIHKLQLKTKEIFESKLQVIMDFCQDILDNTSKGTADFSKISLLSVCIDELMVAFHLSQRCYVGQAFSHMRTITEALDLIILFDKEPKWADLWTSEKPWQEIWKELSPGKVRQKIGEDTVFKDIYPGYPILSSFGTHPSFDMMRERCRKAAKPSSEGKPQLFVAIGGTPNSRGTIFSHFFLLFCLIMVLFTMIKSFGKFLNITEVESVLTESSAQFGNFVLEDLIKPIKEADKADTDMVEKTIKAMMDILKEGFV